MLGNLGREMRFAVRGLLRDKGFALTAVLSIGLGVGANAAIFSLVGQALFRLLPVRAPERLVLLDWRGAFIGKGWGSDNLMSYPFRPSSRSSRVPFWAQRSGSEPTPRRQPHLQRSGRPF